MRILRHEAGHVVQHAYQLQRRRRWQQLFGPSSQRYPRYYRPNPASKNFVQHLRLWYAQSHPDEDFAETFAVWLKPRSNWRKRYAGWPALKKLEYVDELMAEIADERPMLTRARAGRSAEPARRDARRALPAGSRRSTSFDTPKTYDRDLHRHLLRRPAASHVAAGFSVHPASPRQNPAAGGASGPANTSSRSMPCSTT